MSKVIKGMLIDEITERLGEHRDMLVVDCSKMDAITSNTWRLALQKKDITAFTVRNTLARQALHGVGVTSLDDILEGPSTLVFGGEDVVQLSKEITKWADDLKPLEVKGGTVGGQTLTPDGVVALSKSPSREELLSTIAGTILSPGANLAAALLGPARMLASQIKQISEGDEDGE